MTDHDKSYESILQFVSKQRRKKVFIQTLQGIFYLVGFLVLTLAIASFLEIVFHLNETVRLGIVSGLAFVGGLIFLTRFVWPLVNYISKTKAYSYDELAKELGAHHERLHDELLNSLQIYRDVNDNRAHYSVDLIASALKKTLKRLTRIDFSHLYSFRNIKKALHVFTAPLLLSGAALIIFPDSFSNGLNHILHPTTRFRARPVEVLTVWPGDTTKVEGDDVKISVKIQGTYTEAVNISLRQENRTTTENKKVFPDSSGMYRFEIKGIRNTTYYSVKAGEEISPVYKINVQKRPFVKNLKLQLIFPSYTKMPARYLEDNVGDVIALAGTQVKIHASINKAVQSGQLVMNRKQPSPLKINGNEVRSAFVVRNEDTYKLEILDNFGYSNLSPIEYSIRPITDQFPVVEILIPGRDVDLSEELKLPISIEAEDDFGFSKLRLSYRVESGIPMPVSNDTSFQYLDLSTDNQQDTRLNVDYLWDLSDINLLPEDIVYYYAEVWDNDRVSGPKRSISRIFTARFPSVYEIYQEVASTQEEDLEKMEDILADSKELKEKLDEIVRELLQQKQIDWLKKQDLEEIATKQAKLQSEVEDIQENLQEMIDRMESNQMLSIETLQMYQELQELFQEIMTPELQRALEKLREAFEQLDENKLRQAINQMQLSQERIQKSLERTINLLKQMQLEQNLDQAAKLTENLAERQAALNEQLEKGQENELANMLHQQQNLEKDSQTLDQMLSTLKQDLKEQAQFQSEIMDSLMQEMQKVMQEMNQSRQQLQKGNMQQASKSGKMSEQELRDMLKQLQKLKRDFTQSRKQEFMQEFTKATEDLLRLSKAQEDLMNQTKELSPSSPQLGQVAESQQQMMQQMGRIANQMYELSQKTFFVTPEIGRAMGKSMAGMQSALKNLEDRNTGGAPGQQAQAMGGINETIIQVQGAMQSLQNASSASGIDEFMQRLQQMSGTQQGINEETMMLGQGKMSAQQQAAMARLAAEQFALRKSLQQLQQEFGNKSEILGRMDGVANEMEEVIKELQRKQVAPRTIDRQRRILSRMLDAQKSLKEREYSKKRRSRSGKTYFVRSPSQIDEKIKQQKDRFLEDLLRARKAGYNDDYLELIRNYFQALMEKAER